MHARKTVSALLVAVGCAFPSLALADPIAEQLFRDARADAKAEHWESARDKFRESHRLEPTLGTLLNLALVEEKLGEIASGWEHASAVEHGLPAGDERAGLARDLRARLEARLAHVIVRLGDNWKGFAISLDGRALSAVLLGTALPIDPGPHEVVATQQKQVVARRTFVVDERATTTCEFEGPLPMPRAPAAGRLDDAPRTRAGLARPIAYALLGVGGGSLAVGSVAGALTIDRKSVTNSECDALGCSPRGLDAAEAGRVYSTVSTVTILGGLALAGAGAVLLLTGPR